MIRTVLGDIPGDALGHAQCHEHLFTAPTPAALTAPALLLDDADKTLLELFAYRAAGGSAVVDAQPFLAGRMPNSLADVSLRTGVHVVAVTGFHKRMFYRDDCPLLSMDAEQLSALYRKEITDGMLAGPALTDRVPYRAGLVKIAFDASLPGGVNAVWLSAAIDAAKRTNAPILVHTEPGCDVFSLLDRALLAGIPAQKLIFCHMDRTCRDPETHLAVLETGAYLNYDSIRRYKYVSMEEELALIRAMLDAGFSEQLLLSLDTTAERMASYGGEIGLDYILHFFGATLSAAGVSAEQIRKMTVTNPARALQID